MLDMGAARPVCAGEIPLPVCASLWRGPANALATRQRWIQSRLTLLVLLGFIHALVFWDGDILLAYGLIGLISWRMIRDAQSVKALFNTGLALYLIGIVVLLLLGLSPVARPTVHGYPTGQYPV